MEGLTMQVRALVVDDEPPGRERLRSLLAEIPDVEIVGECVNGREAVEMIRGIRPDLIFLDVQMPGLSGFDVVTEIGVKQMPLTIFVTAHDEYALRAFEAHALDYLLKPLHRERFQRTVDRVREQITQRRFSGQDGKLQTLLQNLANDQRYTERLVIRSGSRMQILNLDEVELITGEGNYVRLQTRESKYLLRQTMSSVEAILDPSEFVRVHRSAIVKIKSIVELQSMFKGEYVVVLKDGTKVPSSRTYREQLERAVSIRS